MGAFGRGSSSVRERSACAGKRPLPRRALNGARASAARVEGGAAPEVPLTPSASSRVGLERERSFLSIHLAIHLGCKVFCCPLVARPLVGLDSGA